MLDKITPVFTSHWYDSALTVGVLVLSIVLICGLIFFAVSSISKLISNKNKEINILKNREAQKFDEFIHHKAKNRIDEK